MLIDGTPLEGEDAPNVEVPGFVTRLDLPADRVLRAAIGELESVVLIGFTHAGMEWFASTFADGADALWLLQRGSLKLLRMTDLPGEGCAEG